jgi:hypothetical protein
MSLFVWMGTGIGREGREALTGLVVVELLNVL